MSFKHRHRSSRQEGDAAAATQPPKNPYELIAAGDNKNNPSGTLWTWIQGLLKIPGASSIQENYQDLASSLTTMYLAQLPAAVRALPK
jgi:hypothetical protein